MWWTHPPADQIMNTITQAASTNETIPADAPHTLPQISAIIHKKKNRQSFFSKLIPSEATTVRVPTEVQFFMSNQVPFLSVGDAWLGHLLRVHFFMSDQAGSMSKALLTGSTDIGFFTRVQSLMSNQVGLVIKALLTDATHEGLDARMQSFVRN